MVALHPNISNRQHEIYPLHTLASVRGEQYSQQWLCIPDDGRNMYYIINVWSVYTEIVLMEINTIDNWKEESTFRPMRRWEDNIKLEIEICEDVDRIQYHLRQHSVVGSCEHDDEPSGISWLA
jgi:hypothetical protein